MSNSSRLNSILEILRKLEDVANEEFYNLEVEARKNRQTNTELKKRRKKVRKIYWGLLNLIDEIEGI